MKSKYVVKLEYDEDTRRWIASWDKPGGGGVVAEGITMERSLIKWRGALAVLLKDKAAARTALLIPELIGLPKPVIAKLQTAKAAKAKADQEQARAGAAIRKAVSELSRQGLSPRDVGMLLGLSRQWVHQLLKAG
jgi:hypothetical protein